MTYETQTSKKHKPLSPEREAIVEKAYNNAMNDDEELLEIRNYLGTDSDSPNAGCRARQILLENAVKFCRKRKTGSYKNWVCLLSLKLHLSVRNVRENYIAVLLEAGIIRENENGTLEYVGVSKKEMNK